MGTRRVVTGEIGGRSSIVEDGPAVVQPVWEDLWITEPDDPLGRDPGESETLEPPPGASRWRIFSVPPNSVLRAMLEEHEPGSGSAADEGFFHKTNTVDFVYVLDGGDITLRLDDGEVLLHPGDCVVQRATNHAWNNKNETPVRLLVVMTTLP